uniref:Uncharacterized protein n=1 Tax=Romanomermis culicivorax TaxID=13658 RepID=A0A915L406_ROMCU
MRLGVTTLKFGFPTPCLKPNITRVQFKVWISVFEFDTPCCSTSAERNVSVNNKKWSSSKQCFLHDSICSVQKNAKNVLHATFCTSGGSEFEDDNFSM